MKHFKNPLVTLFVFTYNQEDYIGQAIAGAMSQRYRPLQIIISDDASQDRTFDVASNIVAEQQSDAEILVRRNEKNLGLIEHVNLAFSLAKGRLIVAAAGDDISMPDRVADIVEVWKNTRSWLIYSDVQCVNIQGEPIESPRYIENARIPDNKVDCALATATYVGATGAWDKNLFERFGPISEPGSYEDLVFAFRASLAESHFYIDKKLVRYRVEIGISSAPSKTHVNVKKSNLRQRLKDLSVIQKEISVIKKSLIRELYVNPFLSPPLRKARSAVLHVRRIFCR